MNLDINGVIALGGQCIEQEVIDCLKTGQWYEFAETWELPDGRLFAFTCQGFHRDSGEPREAYQFEGEIPRKDYEGN